MRTLPFSNANMSNGYENPAPGLTEIGPIAGSFQLMLTLPPGIGVMIFESPFVSSQRYIAEIERSRRE